LTLREKEMPEDNEDIWSHILRQRVFSAKNYKAMPPLAGQRIYVLSAELVLKNKSNFKKGFYGN